MNDMSREGIFDDFVGHLRQYPHDLLFQRRYPLEPQKGQGLTIMEFGSMFPQGFLDLLVQGG
jgi:hypothetical protein